MHLSLLALFVYLPSSMDLIWGFAFFRGGICFVKTSLLAGGRTVYFLTPRGGAWDRSRRHRGRDCCVCNQKIEGSMHAGDKNCGFPHVGPQMGVVWGANAAPWVLKGHPSGLFFFGSGPGRGRVGAGSGPGRGWAGAGWCQAGQRRGQTFFCYFRLGPGRARARLGHGLGRGRAGARPNPPDVQKHRKTSI